MAAEAHGSASDEADDRLTDRQSYAEEVGLVLEQAGLPRMAGRVLGWLLVCDPPHQSMGELASALQASKSSISNSTRLLIQSGLVERMGLPGERRDYFRIKMDGWPQLLARRMALITAMRELADRGLQLLEGENERSRQRLLRFRRVYAFFERRLPELLASLERDLETS